MTARLGLSLLASALVASSVWSCRGGGDGAFDSDAGQDPRPSDAAVIPDGGASPRFDAGARDAASTDAADALPPAEPPVIDPASDTSARYRCVSLTSTTPGAVIHYTTNGTEPTTASPVYDSPIVVGVGSGMTIKALAVARGFVASAVSEMVFHAHSVLDTVHFDPGSGSFDSPLTVRLSAYDAPTICYTLDGSVPAGCTSSDPYPPAAYCPPAPRPPPPAPLPPPRCAGDALTYDDAGITLAADAGTTVRMRAIGCHQGGGRTDVTESTYVLE